MNLICKVIRLRIAKVHTIEALSSCLSYEEGLLFYKHLQKNFSCFMKEMGGGEIEFLYKEMNDCQLDQLIEFLNDCDSVKQTIKTDTDIQTKGENNIDKVLEETYKETNKSLSFNTTETQQMSKSKKTTFK